jgi:hypothetical protein
MSLASRETHLALQVFGSATHFVVFFPSPFRF